MKLPGKLPADADTASIIEALNGLIDLVGEAHDLTPSPEIIDITDELPKGKGEYGTRSLGDIAQIVIHHVGVDADVSPETTAKYHVKPRPTAPDGWPGIGYHFYVRKDGTVYQTNALETVSYHCGGTCNLHSVGICLEGSFMKAIPTPEQLEATRGLNTILVHELGLLTKQIRGHREVRQTACPGETWWTWKARILP